MRTKSLVSALMLMAVVALAPTMVFAADVFAGTWKQNIEKSLYSPGPPAENPATVTITAVTNGLRSVQSVLNEKGQTTQSEFTVHFGGKDFPITYTTDRRLEPNPGADMVSVKKINDREMEFTYKLRGKVVQVNKVVISKDGQTRTTTQTGTNFQGQDYNNTIVFDKQ